MKIALVKSHNYSCAIFLSPKVDHVNFCIEVPSNDLSTLIYQSQYQADLAFMLLPQDENLILTSVFQQIMGYVY